MEQSFIKTLIHKSGIINNMSIERRVDTTRRNTVNSSTVLSKPECGVFHICDNSALAGGIFRELCAV